MVELLLKKKYNQQDMGLIISGIIKKINLKNSDTDSYITVSLEISGDTNIQKLKELSHRELRIKIEES